MAAPRRGRQTPTQEVTLRYRESKAPQAIAVYEKSKRQLMLWQKRIVRNILAHDKSKAQLWTHTRYGLAVPRQNGKNEVVIVREIYDLMTGRRALHTAQRVTTSHAAFERLSNILSDAGLPVKPYRALGLESITVDGWDGVVNFRTRSGHGGLGESYDTLIIDEAQEYTDDQQSALQYVVTASKNPQTIYTGTPPTAVSAGTVFLKFRAAVLSGERKNAGWAEWSVDRMTDPHNVDAWYEANPSLGVTIQERTIADDVGSDDIDFNIQRLGFWITYNQKSAISEQDWGALRADKLPELRGKLFVGIKFAHDGNTASMAVAVKTADGRVLVEAIDDRPVSAGYQWMLSFLAAADIQETVIDGASGQQTMANAIKELKLRAPILPTVKEVIMAADNFEQAIYQGKLVHMGQASLTQSVTNCDHRAIGSNGGYGYRSTVQDVDVSLLEAAMLAHWACANAKPPRKQLIRD